MIDFSTLQGLTIPEGVVTQITDASGMVLWMVSGGDKVILEVEKITSDTYAAETTYTGEQFILLDIYPKTNGTVSVTYGGLTKTITDTSGAAEPNAQKVFFGTFNGVSDSVATPASGELTIDGDYYAFGCGAYAATAKNLVPPSCLCVTAIRDWGGITTIPECAFSTGGLSGCKLTAAVNIPDSVISIGKLAFSYCALTTVVIGKGIEFIGYQAFFEAAEDYYTPSLKTLKVLTTTPPEIGTYTTSNGETRQLLTATRDGGNCVLEEIIVPKGCGETYKAAAGWSGYADIIVEEN